MNKKNSFLKNNLFIIIAGLIIGIIAVILVKMGNPKNMGFCIACFIRDTAGALKFHGAGVVQYIRPEIIGLVLGASIMAFSKKELIARAGSNPLIRFVLGFVVMVGALMFLGCPLRMMLRIGGGDLNAIVGFIGFAVGILLGILALNKGFSLNRAYKVSNVEGYVFPIFQIVLLIMLAIPSTLIVFSTEGPGSMHAPIAISLIAGLVVGAIAQRTRFCTVASLRDTFMFKDLGMFSGFIALIIVTAIVNIIQGNFNLSFDGQPIAHNDALWNFLGLALVGFASVLLGGCPLRQLILAGEGNIDSVVTVVGMFVGAACCHNFGLASSGEGPTANGQMAVIIGFIVVIAIVVFNIFENRRKEK